MSYISRWLNTAGEYTFNPRFQGISIVRVVIWVIGIWGRRNFQSPFSGDLDCEQICDGTIKEKYDINCFQSPFSGDLDCELSQMWVFATMFYCITFNPRFQGISIVRLFFLSVLRPNRIGYSLSIPVFRGSRLWGYFSFLYCVPIELVIVFQSPFSGDLDCESVFRDIRWILAYSLLSIPVFRGSRLWVKSNIPFEPAERITSFNPRFQGISIVRLFHVHPITLLSFTFNPRFQGISIVRQRLYG